MINAQLAIHIEHLFATPLVIDLLENCVIDPAEITAAVTEAGGGAGQDMGDARARRWRESPPDWLRPLADHAQALATRSTADVKGRGSCTEWRIDVTVFDVAPGDRFEPAPCYEAYWTCLFVLDDGYGGELDKAMGGELVFADPRLPAPMMEMPDLRLRLSTGPQGSVYTPEIVVRPRSGSVIMFPSWLRLSQPAWSAAAARQLVLISLIAPVETG